MIEALFGKPGEFTRTPKYGIERAQDDWQHKKYHQSMPIQPFIELALGLYFTATVFYALAHDIYGTLPFLVLFQFGFLYMGLMSILQQIRRRRPARQGAADRWRQVAVNGAVRLDRTSCPLTPNPRPASRTSSPASPRSATSTATRGVLAYQGYDIHDLANAERGASFEEVCYLLWHGRLPNRAELGDLQTQLAAARVLPEPILRAMRSLPKVDGMDALRTLTSILGHYDPDATAIDAAGELSQGGAAHRAAGLARRDVGPDGGRRRTDRSRSGARPRGATSSTC